MSHDRLFSKALIVLLGVSIPLGIQSRANAAERCISFKPIGASGYEVRKAVSSTGVTPGVRNNWDTDFVVPGGRRFTRYIATITSELPENYNIIQNFKYGDRTSRQVFRRDGARLVGGVPFQVQVVPSGRQPFQVNMNISGRQRSVYRVRASGCTPR